MLAAKHKGVLVDTKFSAVRRKDLCGANAFALKEAVRLRIGHITKDVSGSQTLERKSLAKYTTDCPIVDVVTAAQL